MLGQSRHCNKPSKTIYQMFGGFFCFVFFGVRGKITHGVVYVLWIIHHAGWAGWVENNDEEEFRSVELTGQSGTTPILTWNPVGMAQLSGALAWLFRKHAVRPFMVSDSIWYSVGGRGQCPASLEIQTGPSIFTDVLLGFRRNATVSVLILHRCISSPGTWQYKAIRNGMIIYSWVISCCSRGALNGEITDSHIHKMMPFCIVISSSYSNIIIATPGKQIA